MCDHPPNMILVAKSKAVLILSLNTLDSKCENRLRHQYLIWGIISFLRVSLRQLASLLSPGKRYRKNEPLANEKSLAAFQTITAWLRQVRNAMKARRTCLSWRTSRS